MYWLRAYPSVVRWLFERGVWYSYSGLEILHGGEGGDVEQGARTSKHVLLFAFDPLVSFALSLSFILAKHLQSVHSS